MRARRRFTPSVDFLGVRILPSTIATTTTDSTLTTTTVTASDDTGSPADPTGDGSYTTILSSPDPTTSVSTIC